MINQEHLTITRAQSATQDANTGNVSVSDEKTVYDAPVNAQELSGDAQWRRQSIRSQGGEGVKEAVSTLHIFLELESKISDIKVGDSGTLTWADGRTEQIKVTGTRRTDSSIEAIRLRNN